MACAGKRAKVPPMQKSMATVARRKVRREAARAGKERSVVPCSSVSGTKEAWREDAIESLARLQAEDVGAVLT